MNAIIKIVVFVFLVEVFIVSTVAPDVRAQRAATIWGVEIWMTEDEVTASSNVCTAIASYFSEASGYSGNSVANFYGEDTIIQALLEYTSYCDNNFEFATVFYKGHSNWIIGYYGSPPLIFTSYYLYDNEANHIYDLDIALCTDDHGIHDFVFLWSCGAANEQGQIWAPGFFTVGMSAAWLAMDWLREDSHDNPDYSGHCFISFYYASPNFIEYTGYGSYTLADFVIHFYAYATGGDHTIDQALDDAACYCFGDYFENTWLQGYWRYFDEPGMPPDWYPCRIREFGDGSIILTS